MGPIPQYPATRREDVVETLHGHEIADPYRWLENPDSPETAAWVDEQNAVTRSVLDARKNTAPRFKSSVEKLLDYDRFTSPVKKGSYFYYDVRKGLANQPVLMRADSLTSETAVPFIDPNKLREDGTASLSSANFSPQGKYCAYLVSMSGSDWMEIRIRRTETIDDFDECLEWSKFASIAWKSDETGFYYTRYPEPKSLSGADKEKRGAETEAVRNQGIYYHALGTPQSEDRLVFTDPKFPKRIYGIGNTIDGSYLRITFEESCAPRNEMYVVDISTHFGEESANFIKVADASYDAEWNYIANDEKIFYLKTNWKAPNNRIIAADLTKPSDEWKEIIAEHPTDVLAYATAVHTDRMAVVMMKDAKDILTLNSLRSGEVLHSVKLPDLGSVSGVRGSRQHNFLTYSFSSFLYPGTVYYVDLDLPYADGTRVFRNMSPPGFDPSQYSTKQVFFKSKDGTRVPMFIVGPREGSEAAAKAQANPPTLLYG